MRTVSGQWKGEGRGARGKGRGATSEQREGRRVEALGERARPLSGTPLSGRYQAEGERRGSGEVSEGEREHIPPSVSIASSSSSADGGSWPLLERSFVSEGSRSRAARTSSIGRRPVPSRSICGSRRAVRRHSCRGSRGARAQARGGEVDVWEGVGGEESWGNGAGWVGRWSQRGRLEGEYGAEAGGGGHRYRCRWEGVGRAQLRGVGGADGGRCSTWAKM